MSDKHMPWFKFYPNDYINDTRALSFTQHGAYLKLMLAYYGSEPFPADDLALYRTAGALTEDEQAATRFILKRFFTLEDGVYRQGRCDKERADRVGQTQKHSAAAQKRWTKEPSAKQLSKMFDESSGPNDLEERFGPKAVHITKQLVELVYGSSAPWDRRMEAEYAATRVMLDEGFSELSIVNASLLRVNKTVGLDKSITQHETREEALAELERVDQQVRERVAAEQSK